jgi:CRP-like cAMP-binding protein
MSIRPSEAASQIAAKLDRVYALSEASKQDFQTLPMQVVQLEADQDITREGDPISRCAFIVEGFAYSFKITSRGRRQILGIHLPGDAPDLQCLHLGTLDSSISALTGCGVAFIRHHDIQSLCERNSQIAAALWRTTLIDAAIFREWVTNIGRRQSQARLAHFLCETFMRQKAIDLTKDDACDFPLTQIELGDALGMSSVHVNRNLQELRSRGLISLKETKLEIPDFDRLAEIGDFDPTYLHLTRRHG